jgi:hypothetical protein
VIYLFFDRLAKRARARFLLRADAGSGAADAGELGA